MVHIAFLSHSLVMVYEFAVVVDELDFDGGKGMELPMYKLETGWCHLREPELCLVLPPNLGSSISILCISLSYVPPIGENGCYVAEPLMIFAFGLPSSVGTKSKASGCICCRHLLGNLRR